MHKGSVFEVEVKAEFNDYYWSGLFLADRCPTASEIENAIEYDRDTLAAKVEKEKSVRQTDPACIRKSTEYLGRSEANIFGLGLCVASESFGEEVWRDIENYVGLYQVSDLGRGRSMPGRNRKGRVLKPWMSGRYWQVNLSMRGFRTTCNVHKLVSRAFLGPRPDELMVCHGPMGPLVNTVGNLRYGTNRENQLDRDFEAEKLVDAPERRMAQPAPRKANPRRLGKAVRCSDGRVFPSAAEAERKTGVAREGIRDVCLGKRLTAGGFGWEFV